MIGIDPRSAPPKRPIEAGDVLDMQRYALERKALRQQMIDYKKNRRMHIGPYCTMLFENFHTMLYQVHEMLHSEGNLQGQLEDELTAYNPLIPKGNELSATMLLNIEAEALRKRVLAQLGGIEDTIYLHFADHSIQASYEQEIKRTNEEGKTSSVHFLCFSFTPQQAQEFTRSGTRAKVEITHPEYSHSAAIPSLVHGAIGQDL